MRKHYFVMAMAGVGIMLASPAGAAVMKCMKLSPNSSYTSVYSSNTYKVDWTAASGGVPIVGVSACSSTAGSTVGQRASALTISSVADSNKYCWCKMVSPAVSSWVYPDICTDSLCTTPSGASCRQYCALFCGRTGYKAYDGALNFRIGLFGGLSD